jgi:hypothetical protein
MEREHRPGASKRVAPRRIPAKRVAGKSLEAPQVTRGALGGPPAGVHDLQPVYGPVPLGTLRKLLVKPSASVAWQVCCVRPGCGASARATEDWAALSRTTCRAVLEGQPPDPDLGWTQVRHDLRPKGGGYFCVRCLLPVAARNHAIASARGCPAWALCGAGGVEVPGAVGHAARHAQLALSWKRMHGAGVKGSAWSKATLDVTASSVIAEQVEASRRQRLMPFRGHLLVAGAGLEVCMACGFRRTIRNRRRATSCLGKGALPPAVQRAFDEGALDEGILRRGARAVALAAERGRALPRPPPEPD